MDDLEPAVTELKSLEQKFTDAFYAEINEEAPRQQVLIHIQEQVLKVKKAIYILED